MGSMYRKWNSKERQNPSDPLRVVLFTSRNKDNKKLIEREQGFEERRQSFVWHIPFGEYTTPVLEEKFDSFVKEGLESEMSRMYVSVNFRSEIKIKKKLQHMLIDDALPGNCPLTHMNSIIAGIAAKKECAAEKHWMWDFDSENKSLLNDFVVDCQDVLSRQTPENKTIPFVEAMRTPHGFAVICGSGFDVRKLSSSSQQLINDGTVTLKRDDLLCVLWKQNLLI